MIVVIVSCLLATLGAVTWFYLFRSSAPTARAAAMSPPATTRRVQPAVAPVPKGKPADGPKRIDLCGFGPLEQDNGVLQIPREFTEAVQVATVRAATELMARGDDRARMQGYFLKMAGDARNALTAWRDRHGNCADDDADCMLAESGVAAAASADALAAMVHAAASTTDGPAYALALHACATGLGGKTDVPCTSLGFARWAQIEPGNAAPWILMAGEAERRKDRAALDAAMLRAATAHYSASHIYQLEDLITSTTAMSAQTSVQLGLGFELAGIDDAWPLPQRSIAFKYCDAGVRADAVRAQVCSDLAQVLLEHGETLLDEAMGRTIATRVGWDEARLTKVREEVEALRWAQRHSFGGTGVDQDFYSCSAVAPMRSFLAARSELGEIGMLRQVIAKSGLTTAQAAARARAELDEEMKHTQAEAAAAGYPAESAPRHEGSSR